MFQKAKAVYHLLFVIVQELMYLDTHGGMQILRENCNSQIYRKGKTNKVIEKVKYK